MRRDSHTGTLGSHAVRPAAHGGCPVETERKYMEAHKKGEGKKDTQIK